MATRRTRKSRKAARVDALIGFDALAIEGGLLSPEWLSQVAQLKASQQADADYDVPRGLNLRDEIGRYWRVAQAAWSDFVAGRKGKADDLAVAEAFIVRLLKDSFGFSSLQRAAPVTLLERTYPVGFSALDGRVPVVVAPAGLGLDVLHTMFGEDGRRRSAFGLVQEYLNAQDGALWGLVTDGVTLRIVRDNASLTRPAWIEVDVARLFTEERYADFAALWLLMHASRFGRAGQPVAACPLEVWRTAGREEGTRAREHLRRGVEDALLALGQGFLSHPDNTALRASLHDGSLTTSALFNQLLRLVYRLIFLLTVEERGLLHPDGTPDAVKALYSDGYSLRRLRERSVRRSAHDRFVDLWQVTRLVTRGVANGEPRLGLPALAGLFAANQCAALDGATLDNRSLLTAMFKLSWLKEDGGLARVNWRDMGPEELGSVYESLLELVPQVTSDGRGFAFAGGDATQGNARKTSGSYYTPDSLVQVLLDSALEPVIADTLAKNPQRAVEALLELSIVDPACGSGHFLLGAARRLATHVARLQAGGTPSAAEYRHALRQVVGRCIYGVDLNPMAVELCKVSLWMEAVEPGLPLTFLNAHIQHGNALLGTTPELMKNGIPDTAWEAIDGDDKKVATALKKRNKEEGRGLLSLALAPPKSDETAAVAQAVADLEAASDADLTALAYKESRWSGILDSTEYRHQKQVADAWCAAFVWPKQPGPLAEAAPTVEVWRRLRDGQKPSAMTAQTVAVLAEQYHFFHWHLQFPRVFERGGFDVVLGNPPWEQVVLNEEEWFAARHPEIAAAPNSAARRARIDTLDREVPLFAAFQQANRSIEGEAFLVRKSGAFPLTGKGRINTYSLFQELSYGIIGPNGSAGIIIQTGALTDFSQAGVTAELVRSSRLTAAFDFENGSKEGGGRWFPSVHQQTHFVLLSFLGAGSMTARMTFACGCISGDDAKRRAMQVSSDFVSRISPNTKTLVLFTSDREISIAECLLEHGMFLGSEASPSAGISFSQPFNASSDSDVFRRSEDLGFENVGPLAVLHRESAEWWPLLEAKCGEQFNHRYGSFEGASRLVRERKNAGAPLVGELQLKDPSTVSVPRYWVEKTRAMAAGAKGPCSWQLLYRFSAYPENERTMICWLAPAFPSTHIAPRVMLPGEANSRLEAQNYAFLSASLNSFPYDFLVRRRMSRQGLDFFIIKQTLIPKNRRLFAATPNLTDWVALRVLELTYTAWDLAPYAHDVGYDGPPFRWDPARRFLLRCELDAAFFHLYGLNRDDTDYVMETFPIVKKHDERDHGEYRTKRVILEIYDAMAEAVRTGTPYQTRLDPPPADPRVAHPPRVAALPAMPNIIPPFQPAQEPVIAVWALLHAAGGTLTRTDLARAFTLRARPRLLAQLAPSNIPQVSDWVAKVSQRPAATGTLAPTLRMLADRDGITLGVNAESGWSIVSTTPSTPGESQIDPWFHFEARLVLQVLRAQPESAFTTIDASAPADDHGLIETKGRA